MNFMGENNWKSKIINGNCGREKMLTEMLNEFRTKAWNRAFFAEDESYCKRIILGWQSYETILSFRSIVTRDDRLIEHASSWILRSISLLHV